MPYGETVYWSATDSEENFQLNPKPQYTATSITYSYNSYGFREDEFDLTNNRSKILCLGCSHTEGVGLKLEDVWVSKVKQNFSNFDVYNLGVGGSSSDTVVRILINSIEIFKPEHVFILWPSKDRFEIFDPEPSYKGPWNCQKGELDYYAESNTFNNQNKNRYIVKLMSKCYNFKLWELCVDDLLTDDFYNLVNDSPARDEHYGPRQHEEIFKKFMELPL